MLSIKRGIQCPLLSVPSVTSGQNAKELTFKTSQTLQQDLEIHTQIRSKVIFPRAVSFVILRLALSLMIILQVQVIV